MKFTVIILLFTTIGFSASAQQWWKISLKKHKRDAQLVQVKDNSIKHLPGATFTLSVIPRFKFKTQSDYILELQQASVMKNAQHHMRFREYDIASRDFSDLAQLYIKENRFSEAKWFLLQSNLISRQQNDDKHTIANLMDLAMVKANMGDLPQAQQDLAEARQMALTNCWQANVSDIDKESKNIQGIISTPKDELRYASDAIIINKKAADKKTD